MRLALLCDLLGSFIDWLCLFSMLPSKRVGSLLTSTMRPGIHNDSHYKSTQESTQESASWGPNAPMPIESSPHCLKLGHTSLRNMRSLPGPAEVGTERTTGLSSKGQQSVSRYIF